MKNNQVIIIIDYAVIIFTVIHINMIILLSVIETGSMLDISYRP